MLLVSKTCPSGGASWKKGFVLPIGAPRGYHLAGVGGGARAVGPVLVAAADPSQVVKLCSPIGRTNFGALLWDKTWTIVLIVG